MPNVSLVTVKARDALKPRRDPYFQPTGVGRAVGFRKMSSDAGKSSWFARYRDESSGRQIVQSLGRLDEVPPAARFDAAFKAAAVWFKHCEGGSMVRSITVGEACQRYADKQRSEGKIQAANDLEVRFRRWMFSDKQLSSTPLTRLAPSQVHEWREKLIKAPLLRQDRSKQSTKLKAATTINRETAVLKAALNLALRDGYGTSDAAWRYKLAPLKGAIGRRDVYLDANDRRRLIAHASADCAILVKAMSLLPLRPGAVANLVVANFDKRLSVLSIGKDKAGQDRKITLPVSTAEFLMEQSKDKLPNAPLLARAGGGAWNKDSWKHPIKDAAIAAGLPLATTAYAIRHSVITDLVAEHQLDTMTVARLSGTSVMMIDRFYGHLRQQYASEALAKLAL